jgi:hypothetical protein
MTGDIAVPIAKSTRQTSVPVCSYTLNGTHSTETTFRTALKNTKTYIGTAQGWNDWQNIISVRHRGGYDDGSSYGMYIRTQFSNSDSLHFNIQDGYGWGTERTILDSSNYSSYTKFALEGSNSIDWYNGAFVGTGLEKYQKVLMVFCSSTTSQDVALVAILFRNGAGYVGICPLWNGASIAVTNNDAYGNIAISMTTSFHLNYAYGIQI